MAEQVITAYKRDEVGSQQVKKLRKEGWVPAVIYGEKVNQPLKFNKFELIRLLHSMTSEHQMIKVKIDNKVQDVLVKDIAYHIYKNEVVHIDLHKVAMDKKITTYVPVEEVGACKGVAAGGILEHIMRQLEIECFPKDIPPVIEIDITDLEIGQTIHVGEIPPIKGIKFLDDPDQPVVSVVSAIISEEEEAAPAAEEAAQPELIRKREKVEE